MAGATGVPFTARQPPRHPEQRRCRSIRRCSRRFARAELSITIEAYIYWAGEIGQRFAEALAAKAQAGRQGQDPARRGRLLHHRHRDPEDTRVRPAASSPGTTRCGGTARPLQPPHPSQVAHHRRPGRVHGRRRHRRPLERKRGGSGRTGATCRSGIEGPAVTPLQTGFAQNWLQTTGELISGPLFYPPHWTPAGPLAAQTIMSSPEIGASTVRTMYYLSIICARESIYIANPYFVPDEAAIDALVDARNRGVDVRIMVSGIRNDNWLARQNSVRSVRPVARGRHRHSRIQPDDAPSQDDGRRRRLGHDRDDQLRQPIVRAQRREQRLLLRRGHCVRDARDVSRGCARCASA